MKKEHIVTLETAIKLQKDTNTPCGEYAISGTDCVLKIFKIGIFRKKKYCQFLASGEYIDLKWIYRIFQDDRITLKKEVKIKNLISILKREDKIEENRRLAFQANFREEADSLLSEMITEARKRGYRVKIDIDYR